jgi:thiamine biosynthesis lipoprotein
VKALTVSDTGVATTGTSIRGQHIYHPQSGAQTMDDVISITVIGPNIYDADRFATAAFAMGNEGIAFIENLQGFEGYMIDNSGMATLTSGFMRYVCND